MSNPIDISSDSGLELSKPHRHTNEEIDSSSTNIIRSNSTTIEAILAEFPTAQHESIITYIANLHTSPFNTAINPPECITPELLQLIYNTIPPIKPIEMQDTHNPSLNTLFCENIQKEIDFLWNTETHKMPQIIPSDQQYTLSNSLTYSFNRKYQQLFQYKISWFYDHINPDSDHTKIFNNYEWFINMIYQPIELMMMNDGDDITNPGFLTFLSQIGDIIALSRKTDSTETPIIFPSLKEQFTILLHQDLPFLLYWFIFFILYYPPNIMTITPFNNIDTIEWKIIVTTCSTVLNYILYQEQLKNSSYPIIIPTLDINLADSHYNMIKTYIIGLFIKDNNILKMNKGENNIFISPSQLSILQQFSLLLSFELQPRDITAVPRLSTNDTPQNTSQSYNFFFYHYTNIIALRAGKTDAINMIPIPHFTIYPPTAEVSSLFEFIFPNNNLTTQDPLNNSSRSSLTTTILQHTNPSLIDVLPLLATQMSNVISFLTLSLFSLLQHSHCLPSNFLELLQNVQIDVLYHLLINIIIKRESITGAQYHSILTSFILEFNQRDSAINIPGYHIQQITAILNATDLEYIIPRDVSSELMIIQQAQPPPQNYLQARSLSLSLTCNPLSSPLPSNNPSYSKFFPSEESSPTNFLISPSQYSHIRSNSCYADVEESTIFDNDTGDDALVFPSPRYPAYFNFGSTHENNFSSALQQHVPSSSSLSALPVAKPSSGAQSASGASTSTSHLSDTTKTTSVQSGATVNTQSLTVHSVNTANNSLPRYSPHNVEDLFSYTPSYRSARTFAEKIYDEEDWDEDGESSDYFDAPTLHECDTTHDELE